LIEAQKKAKKPDFKIENGLICIACWFDPSDDVVDIFSSAGSFLKISTSVVQPINRPPPPPQKVFPPPSSSHIDKPIPRVADIIPPNPPIMRVREPRQGSDDLRDEILKIIDALAADYAGMFFSDDSGATSVDEVKKRGGGGLTLLATAKFPPASE
jgi:hypothetical protein